MSGWGDLGAPKAAATPNLAPYLESHDTPSIEAGNEEVQRTLCPEVVGKLALAAGA
jgi:hypothetical protein